MKTEIDNACSECVNEIHEYLDVFNKKYLSLQKELFSYKREKHNFVNEVDYSSLYHLRIEISNKLDSLRTNLRKILEKNFN